MNDDLKNRAEEIFCSALEVLSPRERESFLDHECQGDARLRAVVDKLLALQPLAEKFFQELDVAQFLTSNRMHPSPQPLGSGLNPARTSTPGRGGPE